MLTCNKSKLHLTCFFHHQVLAVLLRRGHLVTTAVKVLQSTNTAKPSLCHVTKLVIDWQAYLRA